MRFFPMASLLLALLVSASAQAAMPEADLSEADNAGSSVQLGPSDTITDVNVSDRPDAGRSGPDFSGAWAKDYARSDKWQQKLQYEIDRMRAAAERQSRSGRDTRFGPGVININQGTGRGPNIIDLGRFAELITRSNDLYITQTEHEVRIKRKGASDLVCSGSGELITTSANQLGSEVCSWQGNRLFFTISLPGRIDIHHRFEVSPDHNAINQQTRVSYGNHLSFDLAQFFEYYGPSDINQFNCTQTLSRGKVCSRLKNTTDDDG